MPRLYRSGSTPTVGGDKREWIVQSLEANRTRYSRAVKVFDVWSAGNASDRDASEVLELAHSAEYIRAIETGQPRALAESNGRPWDESLFSQAFGSVWSLAAAAMEVCGSRADGSSGRIVGAIGGGMHHAQRSLGQGGCTFNGLAIAAALALSRDSSFRMERQAVLLLDMDGGCGGGTAGLIADTKRVRQLDVAVNERDAYDSTTNATLHVVTKASDYLTTLQTCLDGLDVAKESSPLCIYSAGVDGFEGAAGGLAGITAEVLAERDRLVFEWCRRVNIRTVYTLGSGDVSDGLSRDTIVALHRQTIEAAVAASWGKE
jgi:acetoin utilization deacetylase AcuC-like enzyme